MNFSLMIVVTHDVSERLRNYDAVLVFKKGILIEHGSYEELVQNKGYFYNVLLA